MGSFFSSLNSGNYPAAVFIDFENAKPTGGEQKIFDELAALLSEGESLITEINEYKGCGDLQRAAMMNKSPDAEEKCFDALLQSVAKINRFFEFSGQLETIFPKVLNKVCATDEEGKEQLVNTQALAMQIAQVFDFTLRFDQERMMKSPISNDFSYYRRLLPKFTDHPDIVVGDDEASHMAMFTAEHIPMMSSLTKAGTQAAAQNENVTLGLALLANSCLHMINNKSFSNPATNLFCARAMTGSIVLYDRISELGVFHKKSPVQLKACVQCLKAQFSDDFSLLNAIHFSTRTFRNAPSNIQSLFD